MCEVYKAYFGMPVGDQDKSWSPHFTFEYCKKTLEGKMNNFCSLRLQCFIFFNFNDLDLVQFKELQLTKCLHMSIYYRKIWYVLISYLVLSNV